MLKHVVSLPRVLSRRFARVAVQLVGVAALLAACVQLPQGQANVVWMASDGNGYDLWQVPSVGGQFQQITRTSDVTEGAPAWSPNRKQLALQGFRADAASLFLLDMTTPDAKLQPLETGLLPGQSDTEPAWSPDGSQLAFVSDRTGNRELFVVNLDGTGLRQLTNTPDDEGGPDWAPDGKQIVFHRFDSDDSRANIFVISTDGREEKPLTNLNTRNIEPAWSPDGKRVAFMSNRDGNEYELYMMRADGKEQFRLTRNQFPDELPAWSPDGAWLVYTAAPDSSDYDLYVLRVDGDRAPQALVKRVGDDRWPAWR